MSDLAPAKQSFSPKYLVNMGIYSALYFVLFFAMGMLGIFAPFMMFVGWTIGLLANGTVIMLYIAKTPTFGILTVCGVFSGLLMFLSGHPWMTPVACIGFGLIADFIIASGKWRSRSRNILGYAVAQLWFVAPLTPIFYDADNYFAGIAEEMQSTDYADAMRAIFTPTTIVLWGFLVFFIALVGGWVGTKLVAKHFAKAGLV